MDIAPLLTVAGRRDDGRTKPHTMASLPGAGTRPRHDDHNGGPDDGDLRTGLTATSLFLVLILFWIVTRVEYVIVLVLFGLLLGTILEGPVRRIEARRVPRPAAIFMIYAGIIGLLVLAVFLIIPVIADQADEFREDVPAQLQELENDWRSSSNGILSGPGAAVLERAQEFLDNPNQQANIDTETVQNVIPLISSVTAGIIGVVTTLVITFYYLMERAFIRKLVISQLHPDRQARIDRIWQDVENKVGGWMRGQLFLMLIIGIIATTSYGILGLRFWPLLGLWAGLTEIIPIVGPWIGGVPAVIVALTMGWDTALITAIIIVSMQTLENWVLVPRVMKGAVGLTPLTVFLAILTGTQFMGVTGAILAIPIAAGIQVILSNYFAARQMRRDSQQPSGWRWMLNRAGGRYDESPVTAVERFPGERDIPGQTISEDFVPLAAGQSDGSPHPDAATGVVPAEAAGAPQPAPPETTAPAPEQRAAAARRQWTPFGGQTQESGPPDDGASSGSKSPEH
jgi:predicted PurR-regulated permease PerM